MFAGALTARAVKPIHLALQGGGAHGALTWGVLDRLLADGRLGIRAVSGTSAGAMNAVVLAHGFADGGAEGARAALTEFWQAVGGVARLSPVRRGLWDRLRGRHSLDGSPAYLMLEGLARLVPPERAEPARAEPPAPDPGAAGRFRAGARRADRGARGGDQRAHRPAGGVLGRGADRGRGDGLGLPAAALPGGRDRRRGLLGRRLHRQPGAPAADRRPQQPRHPDRADQPGAARGGAAERAGDRQPDQRDRLQREPRQGARARWRGCGGAGRRTCGCTGSPRAEGAELTASSKLDAEWGHLAALAERGQAAADAWLEEHLEQVGVAGTLDLEALGLGCPRSSWRSRWPFRRLGAAGAARRPLPPN